MSSSVERLDIAPAIATGVRFSDARLHVHLDDGREMSLPLSRFPNLERATVAQRDHWQVTAFGTAIRWPDLDEDVGVSAFLGVPEAVVERAAGFKAHKTRR